MTQYKTPNVYIEEISSAPPSVISGATAVPAFIGYTEIAGNKVQGVYEYHNKPVRITSMIEYENLFGKAYFADELFNFDLTSTKDNRIKADATKLSFVLYYQLQMYFANGGGVCYIVSVGQYGDDKNVQVEKSAMLDGLQVLETEDEPTLIVLTDAVNLNADAYYDVCQQALAQCNKLKDRFVILDVPGELSDIDTNFRTKVGQNNLQYGAAYYPYLNTSFSYSYEDKKIVDSKLLPYFVDLKDANGNSALRITSICPTVNIKRATDTKIDLNVDRKNSTLDISIPEGATIGSVIAAWNNKTQAEKGSFNLVGDTTDPTPCSLTLTAPQLDAISLKSQDTIALSTKIQTFEVTYSSKVPLLTIDNTKDDARVTTDGISIGLQAGSITVGELYTNLASAITASTDLPLFYVQKLSGSSDGLTVDVKPQSFVVPTLESIKVLDSKLYFEIKDELDKLRLTLPPSATVAGVYASVDRDRGVWKAPANVSLNSVIGPKTKITDAEQENLNVHDSGKSINVIRSFTGKGTLVWGSRTLAGNDNEWRYVPVRRLFNLIEKAVKSSTSFAIFEPNTEMTWLKVRVMIENYLNDLWSQGALAGSKAEDAYFVQIGLGKTMTAQDILEGRMITKIGIAAVRPAEFIILQFSHLVQKS